MNPEVPIVIAFDENYLMPACVLLTSMLANANEETTYRFFIFADPRTRAFSEDKIIATMTDAPRHSVTWLDPAGDFSQAKNRNHLTTPNYYRFLIPDYLKEYGKALWIDVDMVVKRDLSELLATDLSGMYLGAVKIGLHNAGVMHVPWDEYFNAGLLLMNLELWRRDNVTGQVRKLIAENDFSCPTQDPINLVGYAKTVFLPVVYNVYLSPKSMKGHRKKEYLKFHRQHTFSDLIEQAAILHFVENLKPWNYEQYPEREEWMPYFRKSVCKDEILLYVKRPSRLRTFAIRILSMLIADKKKRRKFRERIWNNT